jgi:hypothetical protein
MEICTSQRGISLVFLVLRLWSRGLFGGIGNDYESIIRMSYNLNTYIREISLEIL